ncbi:MAG TPA: VTT domain-containing protein [Terriglobales bacterium]|nr:VTT domain-containing protein [Terriglobales bacterium]
MFRHLGALGLFSLAILDSTPLPTFGGPDILIVILVVTHRNPWYECAIAAAAGSVIGAYITFSLARGAGRAYLDTRFGQRRVPKLQEFFERWGTGALVASTAIPFPLPTSVLFAAAGASDRYNTPAYLSIVGMSRLARYSAVAIVGGRYGRHVLRVLRHPVQYWSWFLLVAAIFVALVVSGIIINKRVAEANV